MKKEPERQVVVATYYSAQSVFKVPECKDINTAHDWWVKYNTLHIYWTEEDADNDNNNNLIRLVRRLHKDIYFLSFFKRTTCQYYTDITLPTFWG